MKLACQEGMVPGASLEEKLDRLAEYGYHGIEFWGSGLWERTKEILQATAHHPIKPSTLCAGYSGCLLDPERSERQKAVEDIKKLLSVSAEIGAIGLIIVPIFGRPRLPDLSPYKSAIELEKDLLALLLEDIGKHAERVGTYVLVEPLNRYETHLLRRLQDGVEVCQRVGNPYVKIMADFFHMSIEESNIAEAIRQAGPYIAHIHLADSNRLLPGYGHTDWKSGFSALKEIGFQNYMALECGIPGDPKEELPKCAQFLSQFL